MIMNKEEFNKRRMLISNQVNTIFSEIDAHAKEEIRVIKVLHNAPQILDRLEQNFEERTSLNKIDCTFLLIATALQLVRI